MGEDNKYRTLLQAAMDGFWLTDLHGRILETNAAYCLMSGFSEEEVCSMTVADLDDTGETYEVAGYMEKNIEKRCACFESRHRRKDGTFFDVVVSLRFFSCGEGGWAVFIRDTSELKKSQQLLYQNEKKLRAVIDNSFQLTGLLDAEGKVLMGNKTAMDFAGVTEDDLLGSYFWDTKWWSYSPESHAFCKDAVQRAMKGESIMAETAIMSSRGQLRTIDFSIKPVFDDSSKVLYMVPEGKDITDLKDIIDKFEKNEKKLMALLDNSFQLTGLLDAEGKMLMANKTAMDFAGVTEDDLLGRYFWDTKWWTYSAESHAFCKDAVQRAMKGEPIMLETPIMSSEGKIRMIDFSLKPVLDEHGNVIYMVPEGRDITEKIETAEILRKEEKKYRTILQTAVDGYWLADVSGRILEVNDAYCRMSGYSEKELLSMHIADLEGVMGQSEISFKVEELMKQGQDRYETKHRRKDGSLYDVEVSCNYLGIEDGRLVLFLRDMTLHNEAEKEKKSLQLQLLYAQKMDAIGRLAGGVAHDFNNMLNVILGYTELALEQEDPSRQMHPHLQEIMKAGRRSADIVRQLLAFASKQTIAPKVLDLNEAVENMLKMIQRLIGEDIRLTWIPLNEACQIKIDPSQVDQVLINLCINARDAIRGVGKIVIETGKVILDEDYCKNHMGAVPGDFALLSVSDDGCGMENDTLENIFEPFFTTKGLQSGTGLGLATVYGIVRQNKGFINVYSEPNIGTTFKLYFPRNVISGKQAAQKVIPVADVRGSKTILLVEDELMILNMAKLYLEKLGYHVLAASTPGHAMELANTYQGRIDLLLTDVIMPEMNGSELAKRLLLYYPNLKHLFMSGYTSNIIAHHGVLDEGINFIQKPFTKKELAVKVRDALWSAEHHGG